MSVDAASPEFSSLAQRVRDALMAAGKLTPEGSVRIDEAMRAMGLGFTDAATHLGLVSQEDIVEALDTARQPPPGVDGGIIQGALIKLAGNRSLPVKYVGQVKPGAKIILAHDPDNPYSEGIRALRTELQLLNALSYGGTSIAVLSPCQGEGKTQLCAELAIAFSQLGRRTLLVDANLRRPRMHTLFESENTVGLAHSLSLGGPPQLLGVEKFPHLSLLTAGPEPSNPLELLSNGPFQKQISDWRNKYQMVIIDTPPITEYADGLAIASFAEQVLIVSRANYTPHKNMSEMLRRLATTQSRIVGAVINHF